MACNCKCACRKDLWTEKQIGDQSGKKVIVTGANSGIGYYTALELGRAGAEVIVACRDLERGQNALDQLRKEAPDALFTLQLLDLASLSSVKAFSDRYLATNRALDILVNNAGVMMPPERQITDDGFELQFGTNHLGHFALTGRLLPALRKSSSPRVVTVSSLAAAFAKICFDDLQHTSNYKPLKVYSQSKLANLLFMKELSKRADCLTSVAAHPGVTVSNLQRYAFKCSTKLFGQKTHMGALPTLRAAVDSVQSGDYFGPGNFFHMRGLPVKVGLPCTATDSEVDKRLWDVSEQLTGVKYDFTDK